MSQKKRYVVRPVVAGDRREVGPDLEAVAVGAFGRSRRELVTEAAYNLSARRGFRDGDPVADWLQAERAIDDLLVALDVERERAEAEERIEAVMREAELPGD